MYLTLTNISCHALPLKYTTLNIHIHIHTYVNIFRYVQHRHQPWANNINKYHHRNPKYHPYDIYTHIYKQSNKWIYNAYKHVFIYLHFYIQLKLAISSNTSDIRASQPAWCAGTQLPPRFLLSFSVMWFPLSRRVGSSCWEQARPSRYCSLDSTPWLVSAGGEP